MGLKQMTKARAELTELEGAILGVVRRDQNCTAYHIRQEFLTSPSAEWSGSAGAVYPAIRRMKSGGLVRERSQRDGRGTKTYVLTAAGKTAHDRWLCDVERAIGPGLDPFRTRAGFWPALAADKRRALLQTLKKQIAKRLEELERELPSLEGGYAVMIGFHLAVLELRLRWIDEQLK